MEQTNNAWKLISERLISWYEIGITNLPNFVVAITLVIAFSLIGRWIGRFTGSLMGRNTNNEALSALASTTVKSIITLVGIFIALGVLKLDKTVTSLLAGAGVIGLALGFAFQDIAANFVSGMLIAFREPYKIGDIVKVEGYTGTVRAINLRTTLIETFQGIEIFIPNQYMFTKPLENISGTPRRRLDLELGVSYAEDLRSVTQLIKKSLESLEDRVINKPVEVFFKEFGTSSINCEVRVWISYPSHQTYLETRHDMIVRIKEAFDHNDITIPFPIRTLDFGIKGGESLEEPLSEVFSVKNA